MGRIPAPCIPRGLGQWKRGEDCKSETQASSARLPHVGEYWKGCVVTEQVHGICDGCASNGLSTIDKADHLYDIVEVLGTLRVVSP